MSFVIESVTTLAIVLGDSGCGHWDCKIWGFLLRHRVQLIHESKSSGLQHPVPGTGGQLCRAHKGDISGLPLAKQEALAGGQLTPRAEIFTPISAMKTVIYVF